MSFLTTTLIKYFEAFSQRRVFWGQSRFARNRRQPCHIVGLSFLLSVRGGYVLYFVADIMSKVKFISNVGELVDIEQYVSVISTRTT